MYKNGDEVLVKMKIKEINPHRSKETNVYVGYCDSNPSLENYFQDSDIAHVDKSKTIYDDIKVKILDRMIQDFRYDSTTSNAELDSFIKRIKRVIES